MTERAASMTTAIADGDPAPRILEAGKAADVGCIVMGSRGLSRVQALFVGGAAEGEAVTEDTIHAFEREAFIELAATPETVTRIEHMLVTGRPLRN